MNFRLTQNFFAAALVFGLVAAAPVAELEVRGHPSCGQRRAAGGDVIVDCIGN